MKLVIQRCERADVKVDGKTVGEIGKGFLVLLGVGQEDTEKDCERLAAKMIGLRIFSDENDKINLSLKDVGGSLLIISQFTLYADTRKGAPPQLPDGKGTGRGKPALRVLLRGLSEGYPERPDRRIRRGYEGKPCKRWPVHNNT